MPVNVLPTSRSIASEITGIRRKFGQGRRSEAIAELADAISLALNCSEANCSREIAAALCTAAARADLLTLNDTQPCAERYARHLLHADPGGRFTILAIVWGPGQASPIHAHHTWCAYAVRSGVLTETLYRFNVETGAAVPARVAERRSGYGCYGDCHDDLDRDAIHRIANQGTQPAISIHAYGVEVTRIATGVNRLLPA